LLDHYEFNDRLTFENQLRTDWFSETCEDWSMRTAALYSLDKEHKHILKLGFGKAFRSPAAVARENIARAIGGFFELGLPSKKLKNEKTESIELGYTGRISGNIVLKLDGYYQRFDNLIHLNSAATEWANLDGGDAAGAELELTLEEKWGKLSTWYAYNYFRTDQYAQGIRSFYPSYHKAGITGRFTMSNHWTLNSSYIYNDGTILPMSGELDETDILHRFDISLSRPFAGEKGELMVGVTDVLNDNHDVIFPNGQFTNHETPGRSAFLRLQLKF
jgi:outer membrane cobalamin receptor